MGYIHEGEVGVYKEGVFKWLFRKGRSGVICTCVKYDVVGVKE